MAHDPCIISLSMVKNEQDIIEPFLRHHAATLRCDDRTRQWIGDATRDIVLSCARELGNIILGDDDTQAYVQATRMSRMLEACQVVSSPTSYCFWTAMSSYRRVVERNLLKVLNAIPRGGIGLIPWRTFVVAPDEVDRRPDPPQTMRWRRQLERPLFWKAAVRLDGFYRRDLMIEQGNHALTRPWVTFRLSISKAWRCCIFRYAAPASLLPKVSSVGRLISRAVRTPGRRVSAFSGARRSIASRGTGDPFRPLICRHCRWVTRRPRAKRLGVECRSRLAPRRL